jgi:hypothetical protein
MSHPFEYDTLEQFFLHFKLPHRMSLLCEKLGIESVDDLHDVRPDDLHELNYKCWAQEKLTVVERNRFSRAVAFVDNTPWRDDLPKTGQASPTLVDRDNFEETRMI